MNTSTDWFASWFDTNFYHILYKNRDHKEARLFMANLVAFLNLKKNDTILDLACGKGRHSLFLNSLGFNVTGADLSENSIKYASQFENETLKFVQHDMRIPFKNKYDAIFNLFTSFGYFENDNEDIQVLNNIKNGLKTSKSIAVIDFLNVQKAVANLVKEETIERDQITFNIKRLLKNGFIIKEIEVVTESEKYTYFERIKYLDLPKIIKYLETVGLTLQYTFGDYDLQKFDVNSSNRLILIISK
ncbi:SAM-dependent methyltransferase [Urechidicola croceus]|uniref:Methyltransferase n=1 Tax=Urechidicola croceus TaxID=1850246 RepID=A0A1D8P4R1_9FLAO|nr:class I SAM-dependent methyltransferase [Urechidicola croceus]AOW19537.1 methyltransferase [Urechidicola croceus]